MIFFFPVIMAFVLMALMMVGTVYSIVANDATVGTTIGTFDPINTRNGTIQMTNGTKVICGIAVGAARAAQTTGTAMLARLRLSSTAAEIAEGAFDVALGYSTGGGIATQSGGFGSPVEFIPVEIRGNFSNGGANFSLSQMGIEPADNWAIQVGLMHADAPPPAWWWTYAAGQGYAPIAGAISSNGGSTTTARTSLTANTTVPGYLRTCVGYRAIQAQDAVQTTAEAEVSFTDLNTTINGITPQEYPTDSVNPALAGTLVGLGLFDWTPVIPQFWRKGDGTETVEPFVTGLVTLTAANAYGYGYLFRRE